MCASCAVSLESEAKCLRICGVPLVFGLSVCCYDCCGSLNVDMVVVWAVVDVVVSQLSVPPQVAQTVGLQKRQSQPTKTGVHSMLTW